LFGSIIESKLMEHDADGKPLHKLETLLEENSEEQDSGLSQFGSWLGGLGATKTVKVYEVK
jgi:hypothetical protein